MVIFKKTVDLKKYIELQKNSGKLVGFVPTMGALHEGHIELLKAAKIENEVVIVSIFVNPTQFNNEEDFKKYPNTIGKDINLLEANECDVLFLPGTNEMFPAGQPKTIYELGLLENVLEGKYRPGHFQGVAQVVHLLLKKVKPKTLYLGQKDYQQCMVIKKLIQVENLPVVVKVMPTIREKDGLAMSSRNLRLSPTARQIVPKIFETLQWVAAQIKEGDVTEIKGQALGMLSKNNFKVDYLEIANSLDLTPVSTWDGYTPVVILTAAYLDDIRLIDNLPVQNFK
ncbi:MAG: pantoate--beta-alanine ligase [Ferruginibacter sp.]